MKKHTQPLKLVEVFGSHRQIGQQIGESCTDQVTHGVEVARNLLESVSGKLKLTWEGACFQSRKYLHFAQEYYPQYVEELVGIAEAAGVNFEDVMVANTIEELTDDALHLEKCTSMAVNQERTLSGHVLLAHNEDWEKKDEDVVYLVSARPEDEQPFLAITYGALLPNVGFNSAGIGQACDSVYPNDIRIGIPRLFVSRAVLGMSTLTDSIRAVQVAQRAAGYNHLIAHESGELYNIEASAQQVAYLYSKDGYLVHTNHYQTPNMQEIEVDPQGLVSSRMRCFRAERLLSLMRLHTIDSLQTILRDHVNYPYSICCHIDELDREDQVKTICSLIMDLTDRKLYIAWGSPCQNEYATYQL